MRAHVPGGESSPNLIRGESSDDFTLGLINLSRFLPHYRPARSLIFSFDFRAHPVRGSVRSRCTRVLPIIASVLFSLSRGGFEELLRY